MRLDKPAAAFGKGKSGEIAIVPYDIAKSEFWYRITTDDTDDLMPPEKSKKALTKSEKATLRQWIEQGAPYQKHWAFEAPVAKALPKGTHGIDYFVAAKLKEKKLAASAQADRGTLIRRVAFALTGLPPTPEELDAFLADKGPGAYERMGDRYLTSKHYGEEMARHWLDVARYADTHGMHLDNEQKIAVFTKRSADLQARKDKLSAGIVYKDPGENDAPSKVVEVENVWFEDAFPAGSKVTALGHALTYAAKPAPVFSGNASIKRSGPGLAQDVCEGVSPALAVPADATFFMTGTEIPGRPSLGSWLSYGLGAETSDLPSFGALMPRFPKGSNGQALYSRLWGPGFLPGKHSGVVLRSSGDPVLYLDNPPGVDREDRRALLDTLGKLYKKSFAAVGDPDIQTRIAQYEMAFRMQASVPELTDISGGTKAAFDHYGPGATDPGSFAGSALQARRLVEPGARVVQIIHRGWDSHGHLPNELSNQCRDTDQGCACQIGAISAKLGRALKFDPKTEKFTGDDEANALVMREIHGGWKLG